MSETVEIVAVTPAPALRNGGHVVAEVLARHGVREIFGQDSPEWLYEALDPSQLRAVTMRDERSAGFAADTVARLTGRPTVAGGIHGPGALNLTTALLEAQAACSPLVALISGVETTTFGSGAFQEADHVAIARPLVKWAVRVERPDRLESNLDRALRIAVAGRPGPVLVELPNDVMQAPQPARGGGADAAGALAPEAATGASGLDAVATLLAGAARPVLLAGNGARMAGAADALVALAERLDAPVAVTAMGRGAFPETHPLFAGVAGFMSDRADGSGAVANEVLRTTDVLLVLGSALDGVTTDGGRLPGADATIVRVDVDPEQPARSRRPELVVQGDAAAVAAGLLDALGAAPASAPAADGAASASAAAPQTATALAQRWAAVAAAQAELG
ncbi:MAG TPA: thiamine pyrophosphate-binding protein, partial [Conexibacter sp.]|nr:thiamine pyrophosphate-binding protein [Conexibacter sp.]